MFNKKSTHYQIFIIKEGDKAGLKELNDYLDKYKAVIGWDDVSKSKSEYRTFRVWWEK